MGGFSPFFTSSVMTRFGSSAYGASPREATSHRVIPKRQLEEEGGGERERERDHYSQHGAANEYINICTQKLNNYT